MINLEYQNRSCDCCLEASNTEELWKFKYAACGRSDRYQFDVRNVICCDCGFVFVSPAPTSESLAQYYSDTFPLWENLKLDFNVGTRLEFIRKHTRGNGLIVEIGCSKIGEFQKRLSDVFSQVITMDVNQNVNSDYHSAVELPKGKADMVVHYFVMEHITHVRQFLGNCYDLLKPDGIMLCEMPDLGKYPNDPSGLVVYEHTNHFSIKTLTRIAGCCGFELLEASAEKCSRPFGFSAAFVKSSISEGPRISFYSENKNLFLRGVQKAATLRKVFDQAWESLQEFKAEGKKVVFWAANECLSRFLDGREVPDSIVIIDSNPAKKFFSPQFRVKLPVAAANDIRDSDVIFIFSKIHAEDILLSIARNHGKTYPADNVVIVSDLP
ncbi:MAG: methyltransferase domain-containing protein [Syntrophales bacterium]